MNYALHIIIMACITTPVVLGLNLVLGRGKILHFGSVGVSVFAAYATFLTLQATQNYILASLAGLLAALLISALFAWLALRLDGDAFGILSIAMHLSIIAVVLNWTALTRGTLGLPRIPRMPGLETLPMFTVAMLLVAGLYAYAMVRIDRGKLGRSLAALAENRFHAESLGINRVSVTFKAFLIAGIGAFLSNLFFPQYIGLLHPNDYLFQVLVFDIMCVVAGGPGSVLGVTLATFLLTILQECIRFLPLPFSVVGPLRLLMFGIILLVAVYVRRETVFPKPRTI